jgi:hypothetical protein
VLPVDKRPYYLSYSSLKKYEKMPMNYYLERIAPNPKPREPQGRAASAGSAFDYFVKIDLMKKKGRLESLRETLLGGMYSEEEKAKYAGRSVQDILWCTNVEEQNRAEAGPVGKGLFEAYAQCGFYSADMFKDIEIHKKFVLTVDLQEQRVVVPIVVKMDATLMNPEIPHDWKVKGFVSQASPSQGYKECWKLENGRMLNVGCHDKYRKGMDMSEVNPDYADQLATYGWAMGFPVGTPFYGSIHEIVIRESGVRICVYEGVISPMMQSSLAERYARAWTDIRSGKFLENLPQDLKLCEYLAMEETWY